MNLIDNSMEEIQRNQETIETWRNRFLLTTVLFVFISIFLYCQLQSVKREKELAEGCAYNSMKALDSMKYMNSDQQVSVQK